ncbi:hypothetical protein CYL20_10190 [Pseudomonas palleroniana]|uniref:Uncharacterized protein n=1 Tax=Pseudomonas palleroniana TaxID=191390 RepID=A0A2L1J8U1_9PSED|nr:hypothetical protein [Pseudomonas palleroniana]AVE04889.1 hypothetical protein CYL20_10190 [Pseudomonas palleroniana]
MTKEKTTHEVPSDPVVVKTSKSVKPKALEVDAPLISSEVDSTVTPPNMPGSYLTVDSRMDSSTITAKFRAKEAPELVLEDLVDSSGEAGARKIDIPLDYLTPLMGFTALISYEGKSQGQAATSSVKEVGISFYSASESEALAPRLLHEQIINNTPTYDMKVHKGNETVLLPVHPLAKAGDKVYCTAVTQQDTTPYVFYTVIYNHVLTEEEASWGYILKPEIARGWLARRKPWRSLTLQSAWITSGLEAEPPAEIDPHLETRLPRNALEVQLRRTAALIVDPGLENLPPPHLRQSVSYNDEWCLNPELTQQGGDVNASNLDTYADDQVCFYASGAGYGPQSLGCVTIENDGDQPTVKLSPCIVACFFNKPLTLTYTVQFPNNEGFQSSPERVINVLVPQFARADVEEATNGVVDLNTFSRAATAIVPVWAYAECSNRCWMWISGEREDGSAYRFDILSAVPVSDAWKDRGVDVLIPRNELQKLADCSDFELHFAVTFCDAVNFADAHEFPPHVFTIEQEPMTLLPPSVTEAVGSDLTAYNARNGVQVEVDFVGNSPKCSISVCWTKPDGTCWPLASKPGSTEGAVIFSLPSEAVISGMGQTVPITYTVTTACKVQTSSPLNLNISLPVRLETPNVLEATPPQTQNAVLDLRTFTGNANSLEDTMWFLRAGQKCWLRVTGTDKNGNPYPFDVYSARTITTEETTTGVASPLLRADLNNVMDGSAMTLTFEVATDGSLNANVVCPSRVLKVVAPPEIRYENFTAQATRLISAGQSFGISTMLISFISGPGQSGISNYSSIPGMLEGQALVLSDGVGQASSPQNIRLSLTFGCKRIRFAYTYNHYATSFAFSSPTGDYLGTVTLNGNPSNGWVDFSAPGNATIGRIDIRSGDWMYLDFFTFWL